MKILWLALNSSYALFFLALPALHEQVKRNTDLEWKIVSATINENVRMNTNEIYRHQPDFIAATCWLFNHEALMHITSRVKTLLPHACLILGGPEFLSENESFLRQNPFVDCVFREEGKEEFSRWLKVWNQSKVWSTITELCYLNTNQQYQDNGLARVLPFDQLVSPEKSEFFNWSKPFVQLGSMRGCFNTCTFCVSGDKKLIRTLSMESIRQRLEIIHWHGNKNVRVLDRTFNFYPQRTKELLQLVLEFHPYIRFHLEIHPALLSEDLKAELQQFPEGLLHLEANFQSLREQILGKYKLLGKLEQALTRELIQNDSTFLHHFLDYLTEANLIDQPTSLEKRGLVLYEYCKKYPPDYQTKSNIAWVEAGMYLKKQPIARVKNRHQAPLEHWEVIQDFYHEKLRLCFLPTDSEDMHGYWLGFETVTQRITPVFKAKS